MRSRLRVLSALLVCIGVVVTSASAGTEQTRTAPPPVERVAHELAGPGRKSVIVLASIRGRDYVATAGRRTRVNQRFRIGSVTKTFTATIVLQLMEERKLRLDDTLEDHLPGVVRQGDEITIRRLLLHRSGLVDYTDELPWFDQASRSPSTRPIDVLRYVGPLPLDFEPGSRHRYSNTNYVALGLVIEAVTGRSYAEELERRIFRPLGLAHTELPTTRRLPDIHDEVLRTPWWPWGGDYYNPNVIWATGAIVSNAHDLARFFSALLSGRLLSKASLAAMKRTADDVGLGIFAFSLPCGRVWGHGGWIGEWVTFAEANEKGDRVAVVSVRGGAYPPSAARVLLCPRPRPLVSMSHRSSRIAFVSTPGRTAWRGLLQVATANGNEKGWLALSAEWGTPAWSPDGRKIAFVSFRDGHSEIYVTNADGSGQRRLTRGPAWDVSPAWSPDGGRIAFVSNRSGNGDVYVMSSDGSAQRRLTRSQGSEQLPAWSPNGRKLVFTQPTRQGAQRDVYVTNADGSGLRSLTRHPGNDDVPVWSPDGRRIAFARDFDVYVMDADGSGQRRLTRGPARDDAPAWSPDGRKLVFERRVRHGGQFEVFVVNADGSRLRRLARSARQPRFAPDGRTIAFTSSRHGNEEIYVMNADGSGQRNLTHSPTKEGSFAWSPAQRK